MICFNCSSCGHYVGNCVEPKRCFICSGTHNVNNCITWARLQTTTEYFGSAIVGLGFYHIDTPVATGSNWLN
uniref:CCHC-type domain-containing protein n=1 Tax=Hordeum vulgare subsp. vulgare TaxID=112509 RepID=A0A8I6XFM7_HORVV